MKQGAGELCRRRCPPLSCYSHSAWHANTCSIQTLVSLLSQPSFWQVSSCPLVLTAASALASVWGKAGSKYHCPGLSFQDWGITWNLAGCVKGQTESHQIESICSLHKPWLDQGPHGWAGSSTSLWRLHISDPTPPSPKLSAFLSSLSSNFRCSGWLGTARHVPRGHKNQVKAYTGRNLLPWPSEH